jgi:hypothetical protein
MSAPQRDELLAWIKADVEDGDCKNINQRTLFEAKVLTCLLLMLFCFFLLFSG